MFILVTVFLFLSGPGKAQNYYSRNFTMTDGMPSNSVRAIFKDSEGYLWIGTDGGLCRFDGRKFRIFSSEDGFTGNKIWAIAEDGSKNLWFGDYGGGLWKYDGKTFCHFTEKDSIVDNRVRKLYYSEKWDLLMVGTEVGFTIYDGTNFKNYGKQNGLLTAKAFVTGFFEMQEGIFICTFSQYNYVYIPQNESLKEITEEDKHWGGRYTSCYKQSTGSTILSYRSGIVFSGKDNNLQMITKPANAANRDIGQVFGITDDNHGNIWMASWEPNPENPGGLLMFDGEKIFRKNCILGKDPYAGWSVCYDNDRQILWFGSLDMGLFMICRSDFEYLSPVIPGVENHNISDLTFDTEGNLFVLEKKSLIISDQDRSQRVISNEKFHQAFAKYLKKAGEDDPMIYDYQSFLKVLEFRKMAFQNDSTLWVSSDQAIFMVNLKNYSIKCYLRSGYGAGNIFFTGDGQLWTAGSWGYLSIYQDIDNTDSNVCLHQNPSWPRDVSDYLIIHNEVWLTSHSRGLYRGYDSLFRNYNQSNCSLTNALNVLCADASGNLIIGGNNGEVYLAKPDKDSLNVFRTLDARDGILGNSIVWLEVDLKNNLWVGTNTGLNRISLPLLLDQDSLLICQYDENEGYLHPNVNLSLVDKEGKIWLGTDESLVCLHVPEMDSQLHRLQGIKITNFEVNGESKPFTGEFYDGPEIVSIDLKHDQNYLKFGFDVINFINPEKDLFRYYLKGLDKEWGKFTRERHATYPWLPPGKYIFRVEGRNLNTGDQYIPLEIAFTIFAPFWKTWWFYSLALAVVLLVTIILFRYRINKAHREEQMKAEISKQLAGLEMKALLAQMNPHFTFNAINSIQNYILDNEVDAALAYLADFSKIIRQTLENATKEFITLEDEIDYIKRYLRLEQMRFDRQFSYEIITGEQTDTETTLIPPMIVQPYVENAIKHGLRHKKGEGRLSVEFKMADDNKLLCIIEDNGVGRTASAAINQQIQKDHNSSGMTIARNRIDALKKMYKSDMYAVEVIDLYSPDKHPAGTRVEIVLPLSQPL